MKKKFLFILSISIGAINCYSNPCDTLPKIEIQSSLANICKGDTLTLTASGAETYNWDNNVTNGAAFVPTGTDIYTVEGTDTNGCVGTAQISVVIEALPEVKANISSTAICEGDSVLLNATGAINYEWLTPAIANNNYYTPTVLGAQTYTVKGEGANGCFNTSQVIVLVRQTPEKPVVSAASVTACLDKVFDATVTATSDTGTIEWYTDESFTNLYSSGKRLSPDNTTDGSFNYYVTSVLLKCYSDPTLVETTVYPLPEVDAGSNVTTISGEKIKLQGTVSAGATYDWIPSDDLVKHTTLNPWFISSVNTSYKLKATSPEGCIDSSRVYITIDDPLVISNFLSPNGDGDNDVWKMFPLSSVDGCPVRVFDGFGRILLETSSYDNTWDGTYEGEVLPDGDYYYHISCSGDERKGAITLLR